MHNLKLTDGQVELLRQAVSFLFANAEQAEDELDTEINPNEIDLLEHKLYNLTTENDKNKSEDN